MATKEIGTITFPANELKAESATIPTGLVNKSQLDAAAVSVFKFKGNLDASGSATQLDNAKAGDSWVVNITGTFLGEPLVMGEIVLCTLDVTGTPTDFSKFNANLIDILNILTSTDATKALSAAQGKVLKDLVDALTITVSKSVRLKVTLDATGAATQLDNAKEGEYWIVSVAGNFLGTDFSVGDLLICYTDVTATPSNLTNFNILTVTPYGGKIFKNTDKASPTEINAGTDDNKVITPLGLNSSNYLTSEVIRGEILRQAYLNQIAKFGIEKPLQWVDANFPNGLDSYPSTYPFTVSTITDVASTTTNTYNIELSGGNPLTILKDGTLGNAFHFEGNQRFYTPNSTVSTAFTFIGLMRRRNVTTAPYGGRFITGYKNSPTDNNLFGFWDGAGPARLEDCWYMQDGGYLSVPATTSFKLYSFTNNNDTKMMDKHTSPGTVVPISVATTTGQNDWGEVIYGRPREGVVESCQDALLYSFMVFDSVLTSPQILEIAAFYQTIYKYW